MPRKALLVLGLISALLHAYVGWRLLPDLPWGQTGQVLGLLWLAVSTLATPAPLLLLRGLRPHWLADALAWLGYLAMGVFSSLLVLTFLRDLLLLAAPLLPAAWAGDSLRSVSAQAVVLLSALVSLVGYFNARRLARVVTVEVPIAGLPAALAGFHIAQISDIHVGHTIRRGYLDAIVRRVNGLKADLVAITGDVVDGSVARLRPHVAPLAELQARHGVYAVTGNHEYLSLIHI